jgi:hypothetical protein
MHTEVLRPTVIEVLDDPLAAAKLGDTVLAAQAFQDDADLVFGRKVPPRRATDVFYDLLCRLFRPARISVSSSLPLRLR